MIPAQVVGHAVASHCHPSIHGYKLMICRPLDPDGAASGEPIVAVDLFGAGMHSKVFVSTDGIGARHIVHDEKSPVRHFIQGVIDK
jgi:microcompartment protein CcmK/EutM